VLSRSRISLYISRTQPLHTLAHPLLIGFLHRKANTFIKLVYLGYGKLARAS
jgi:hypothetical protein